MKTNDYSSSKKTALIVEDDPAIRSLVKEILHMENLGSIEAEDGQEGIKALESLVPHLIITDMRMPKMDGLTFIEAIREQDKHTPIIAMSGGGQNQSALSLLEEALAAGASAIIQKPFSLSSFRALVLDHI